MQWIHERDPCLLMIYQQEGFCKANQEKSNCNHSSHWRDSELRGHWSIVIHYSPTGITKNIKFLNLEHWCINFIIRNVIWAGMGLAQITLDLNQLPLHSMMGGYRNKMRMHSWIWDSSLQLRAGIYIYKATSKFISQILALGRDKEGDSNV